MSQKLKLLLLEDREEDSELTIATLEEAGYSCEWERVETREDFLNRLEKPDYDLILSDYSLPTFDGLTALKLFVERDLEIPFILISGTFGEETAIESIMAGATDYVLKDKLFRLPFVIQRALKEAYDKRLIAKAEKKLKLQAAALESAANAIVITNVDGTISWVNPAFTTVTGYSSDEVIGRDTRILSSGKHSDRFFEDLWKTILSGDTWQGEMVNRRKDGSTYVEEQTITPVADPSGRITNFIAIKQDVTERREAIEIIKNNEKQVRDILDNVAGFVVLLTPDGVVLEINKLPLEAWGLTRRDVIGRTFVDLPAWNFSDKTRTNVSEAIEQAALGEVIAGDFQFQSVTGAVVDVYAIFSPILDKHGKVVKVISSGFDVTAARRDEAERKVIFDITRGATTTPNLDEFLKLVHRSICGLLYADNCFIMLHDEATGLNNFEFWLDERHPRPDPSSVGRGLASYVLRSGEPLLISEETRKHIEDAGEAEPGCSSPSWMGVPLRTSARTIGVLVLQHHEKENVFSQRDLEFLTSVGDQVALAIERKWADDALHESEEQYRFLFEKNPLPMWIYDLETLAFLEVNHAAVDHYGYSRDDFLSMTILDIRPADDIPDVMATLELGSPERHDGKAWRHKRKDGSLIDVEITSHALRFQDRAARFVMAKDITKTKRAEEALSKSEERYRDLVENAIDIIYTHDLDGNYTSVNKAVERITGYTVEESLSMNMADTVAADHLEKARQMLADKLSGSESTPYEIDLVAKDGNRVALEVNTRLIYEGDTAVGVQGIARDITERKRAAAEILEKSAVLEAQLNSSIDGILIVDEHGKQVLRNERFIEIFRIPPHIADDPDDAKQVQFVTQVIKDADRFVKRVEYLYANPGEISRDEIELIDGTILDRYSAPVLGTDNKYYGRIWTFRDITESKRFEVSLRESDEKFRQLADNISDVFWIRSPCMSKIYYISPAYESIWGRKAKTGHTGPDGWLEFVYPPDRQQAKEAYARLMLDSPEIEVEYRIVRPDGEQRWVRARGFQVKDESGKVIRLAGIVTDITDKKLAEAEIHQTLQRLHDAQRLGKIGDWSWDIDANVVTWSPEAFEIMGRDPQLGPPKTFEAQGELYDELSWKLLQERVAAAIKTGETQEYELNVVRSDGRPMFINAIAEAKRGPDGKVHRLTGTLQDITERKQARTLLLESQQSLALAAESASLGIWDWDLRKDTIKWDARMYELHRNYDEDFSGPSETWNLNFHPDDVKRLYSEYKVAIEAREDFHSEFRVIWPSGEVRHLESSGRVLRSENDNALHFIGVSWDITERKLAEQSLRDADKRAIREYGLLLTRVSKLALALGNARDLDAIFEDLREFALVSTQMDGFIITLFDADRNVRIPAYVWSDGTRVDVSALPPMEMTSSPHSRSVMTGETIIIDDVQVAPEGRQIVHFGKDVPRSSLVVPMSIMGRIVGGVEVQSSKLAAFQDNHAAALQMAANLAANAIENVRLLERERVQGEQLRQSQKMEAVGALAGGIAHDFNNLLTAINGYSDLTLRRMPTGDPLRHNVEEVKKAGERAAELTSQLLVFSRKQVLKPIVHNLNATIETIEKMLRRIIRENIDLRTVLDPDLGNIKADPSQIEQVIVNLVVNARDAMPGGGTLTIETKNVDLSEEYISQKLAIEPGLFARMTVTDTGIGMDRETRERVFEPFFTTKAVGKGTGLGLPMVYGIVKQSGGDILVYSEPGHGTTIKIYLPLVDKQVEKPKWSGDGPDKIIGTETVLLVEDEEVVRSLVREILTDNGYKVLEASSGKMALSVCESYREPIHLLLTDVIMPGMGGAELKNRVVELVPDIKVLFISGYTDDSMANRGIDDPRAAFLEKPFTPDALVRKLREVLDSA